MISQERYNRLDLELRAAQARIRDLEEQLDRARSVATHAVEVCALCGSQLTWVPFKGNAS